jgi:hypothetical protein
VGNDKRDIDKVPRFTIDMGVVYEHGQLEIQSFANSRLPDFRDFGRSDLPVATLGFGLDHPVTSRVNVARQTISLIPYLIQ